MLFDKHISCNIKYVMVADQTLQNRSIIHGLGLVFPTLIVVRSILLYNQTSVPLNITFNELIIWILNPLIVSRVQFDELIIWTWNLLAISRMQ